MSNRMIENFIIVCKKHQEITPVHMQVDANRVTGIIIVTLSCQFCGNVETQQLNQPQPQTGGVAHNPYTGMAPWQFMRPGMTGITPVEDKPKPEKPKEPEVSEVSKLMQKLIDSEDMRAVEKHKKDFKEWEYNYIIDSIKANQNDRKNIKVVKPENK